MTDLFRPPKFEEDLADFVAELRTKLFPSRFDAANYFHIARSTVSRYESGHIVPPLGYLASLAQLHVNQLYAAGQAIEVYKRSLLQEFNKILRWHYRERLPFQNPFQSWDEINQLAKEYQQEKNILDSQTNNVEDLPMVAQNQDWGEALNAAPFYGRAKELNLLEQWLLIENCRLVALVGLGGIGKTSLAIRAVEQVKAHYDFFLWRSLRNAPPLEELLTDCIKFISGQKETNLPAGVDNKISVLINLLRKSRCLLVFDNLETVLQAGEQQSRYQHGYEAFGDFLNRMGSTTHQSCLLLTSREKPKELTLLESKKSPTRSLVLAGLNESAGRKILEERELSGADETLTELIQLYSGNPLALKLVSGTILELFGGDVKSFLHEGQLIFGDISRLLDHQFERLSELEQSIMCWLAIERELVPLAELEDDIYPRVAKKELLEALNSLRRHSMLERNESGSLLGTAFTQQPVVMEYVTERLIEQVASQLSNNVTTFMTKYALSKAQGRFYVRNSQVRLILQPILERLQLQFESETALEQHLLALLDILRTLPRAEQGYSGGNLANLLSQLKGQLRGYDFSNLNLWQAYFQGINLQGANFAGANLKKAVFTGTFDALNAVAVSQDGLLLAVGSVNGQVEIWLLPESKPLYRLKGHHGMIHSVAFSPDGKQVASGGTDRCLKLWDVQSGHCLETLEGHMGWVWALAFSPDGKYLASGGSDMLVQLWDLTTVTAKSAEKVRVFLGHQNTVRAISFSPDGKYIISGGGDHSLRLWAVSSGECLRIFEGHSGWIQAVTFSPDSRFFASGGEDKVVQVWDLFSDGPLPYLSLEGHIDWIYSLAFSSDGLRLASGSGDCAIRFWDTKSGQCQKTLQGHLGPVKGVTFTPDDKTLISGSVDTSLRLWDTRSGYCIKNLEGYNNSIKGIAFSPNGRQIVGSCGNGTVRVWEVASGQSLKTLQQFDPFFWSVGYSPDGKLIAGGSASGVLQFWWADSGKSFKTVQGHTTWIQSITYSPSANIVATGGGDRVVKLWNPAADSENALCLHTLTGHTEWVWAVKFSPDGKYLASCGGKDNKVFIWEVQTGQCHQTLVAPGKWALSAAFTNNGKIMASGTDEGAIYFWHLDYPETTPFVSVQSASGHIWSLTFSPDDRLLVAATEGSLIEIYDANNGQLLKSLSGHSSWVRVVAFSPDGKLLASCGEDGRICLWQTESWELVGVLTDERLYEGLNITGVTSLSEAQKANLLTLGALDK